MENIEKVRIFHNIIPKKNIKILKAYYEKKPYSIIRWSDEEKGILERKEKHNDYNVSNGIVNKVLYPVLKQIIGEHRQCNGFWAEVHSATNPHVDSEVGPMARNYSTGDGGKNLSILIPLTEGERHQTVFFDYFTEDFHEHSPVPAENLSIEHEMFGHLKQHMLEKVKHIPIDKIFNYKVGDIAVWDRRQLHCAASLLKEKPKSHIIVFC